MTILPRWVRFYPDPAPPRSHVVDLQHECRQVTGVWYGKAILDAWCEDPLRGLVILEWDIAVDRRDEVAMHQAIIERPWVMWAAPYPVAGELGVRDWSGIGCCYLSAEMLARLSEVGLGGWTYPGVDGQIFGELIRLGFDVLAPRGVWPKHLRY